MSVSSDSSMKMSPAMRSLATKMPRARNGQRGLVFAGIAVCVLALVALVWPQPRAELSAVSAPKSATAASSALTGDKAVAQLQKNGQYNSLMQAVEHSRYAVTPIERDQRATGEFFASNPSQKFSARFGNGGVQISPAVVKADAAKNALQVLAASKTKGAAWKWNLKLRAYGYGDAWQAAGAAQPLANSVGSGDARKFSYRRGAVTEWFVNAQNGLEQGFTLQQPPQQKSGNQPLRVALAVSSDLTAREIKSEKNGGVAFADKSGATVLTYRKLRAWDANKRDLSARMNLERGANGRAEIVLAVADAGAAYPITIDPIIATQEAQFLDDNPQQGDRFGASVALDGDTALIGMTVDRDQPLFGSGLVYVFVRNGTTWSQQAKLVPDDLRAGQTFGNAVAISGNVALIGSEHASSTIGGSSDSDDAGVAYVFVRNGTTWSQQARIVASDAGPSGHFGNKVALDGTTALIGANGIDPATGTSGTGAVYVFTRNGTAWSQQTKIFNPSPNAAGSSSFGSAIALDGDTALIGYLNHDTAAGNVTGSAYIYVRNGTAWSQQAFLTASDASPYDLFGGSVALDGDTAIVGANRDKIGINYAGSAYVFVRNGATWSQQAHLVSPNPGFSDMAGDAVAVVGDIALVGGTGIDNPNQPFSGAVLVFARSGTTWNYQTKFTASNTTSNGDFGRALAFDGDTVLISALDFKGATAPAAGTAYIFRIASNTTPPILTDIAPQTTPEDASLSVDFTIGDDQTPPNDLVVTATSSNQTLVTDANLVFSGTGSNRTLAITPQANANGSVNITITVTNADGGKVSKTFALTIAPVDDAPVAANDEATTNEDTPVNIDVLANDSDPDNDALSISAIGTPAHGSATLNNHGTPNNSDDDFIVYTPEANYHGSDSFAYSLNDGTTTVTANVVVTINAVNDAPSFTIGAGQTILENSGAQVLAGFATNISAGPSDESGQTLAFFVTNNHSALFAVPPTITADGTLRYTPATNTSGVAVVSVRLQDNGGVERGGVDSSGLQNFIIRINAINRAPMAQNQSLSTAVNTPLNVALRATDANNDALTFRVVNLPAHGTLSGNAPNLIYTPNANFSGADSFTFVANDGALDSNTATIALQVLAPSAPPVANAQSVDIPEDVPEGILLGGSAPDSDSPVYRIITGPQHGALSGAAPLVTYTPEANFNGSDSFTFQITSKTGASNVATVTLQVLAANDVPVANAQTVRVDNATPQQISLNATDVDNDALVFTIITLPAHGTLVGTAPNLVYLATPGYLGSDFFTFVVSDGVATSLPVTVNLTVGGDAEVKANNDLYTLILGAPDQKQQAGVVLQSNGIFLIGAPGVLRNDVLPPGSKTQVRAVKNPKNGRFLLKDDGTLYYLPGQGKVGVDELTYIFSDGKTRATGIVRLNVIDRRAPELRIDTPRDRATVADVTKIAGRARDLNSGLKNLTLLWQRFDGKFWNGREWTGRATELPLKLDGINWIYAGSLPKPGNNAASDLLEGRYDLRVTATDNSGNIQRATNRIIVKAPLQLSTVRLSSANATSDAITLRFTGALEAKNASDARHYTLLQDGLSLRITQANYAENSVTLSGLKLSVGQIVTLRLEGLLDAAGKTLPSGTLRLTVR